MRNYEYGTAIEDCDLPDKVLYNDVYLNRALDSLGGYVLGGLFLPEPVLFSLKLGFRSEFFFFIPIATSLLFFHCGRFPSYSADLDQPDKPFFAFLMQINRIRVFCSTG
jgi:hypothetical protein